MRNKKNKWLLYATSACLTCGIVGAVTLNQNESVKAFAESTAVDIAQMYICDAAYTGSDNDNTLGADNAFDLNVLSAVIPGSHYIHNDDTYRNHAKAVYEYDITFQLEFSDWGDEGWFGFKNSDYWETRIYNDKAMIYWDMPTYGGASAETAFSQEILGGYHTIRMALDCSDEKVSEDYYLWTYTLTIDDVTYTTTCAWANWSSGHYFEMRNMTGKPVNVISTNSQLPPDISDLAISNNEIGTSGSETAFDFTKVTSVATGAHYIYTNKDYGAWETNAQKIDVRFSMEVVDWSDDAWFGLQTSSFYDLRIYKDKVRLIFTHEDYYGQYDLSVNLATPLSNGWHDINLKLNPVDLGGGTWVIIMTAYVDGRISTPAVVGPNWSGNAYKLVNETGKAVNVLSINEYYVAFDTNGGDAVENVYANRGDAVSVLPTPVNGIKVFEGWYSSADFAEGTKVESISALTSNRTLYAMWSDPITYTVTYEENGGDAIEDAIVVEGNAVELPTPVKGTKIFDGWYSSADFAEGTKVESIESLTANMTLYAKWLNPKYTVTFEENGGDAVEDITAEEGSAVALPTPVKGTKIFDGWYASVEYSEWAKVESIESLTANMTLYAKWLNPTYTVTFEENGAETVADITVEEGSAVALPTPVNGTKIFDGWYSSADFAEGTKVESIESLTTNMTLYAKWSEPVIDDSSDEDTSSEDGSDDVASLFAGCFGSVGSAMSFSVLLGAAALVMKKKKDE